MNVPAVAFVSATSEVVNPVTASENVNVKVIAELLVGPAPRLDVIATVGVELSYVIDHGVEAILPLEAASAAELADTLADTDEPLALIAKV